MAMSTSLDPHGDSLYPTESRASRSWLPRLGSQLGKTGALARGMLLLVNAMHRMIAQASVTAQSWRRLTRWGVGACLLLLALAWASPARAACPGQSFPCDWDFKRKLTFNNAGQLENLVNVPVLVVLNSSRIDYSQTQNAGQDLRFTDSDGTTLLAHEIEKWDETGTSYVWVKVPQTDGSSSTDHIWMFYGNPLAPDGQNPTAVWSNGYAGVWHLREDPSGTAPQIKDSTSNANHGTSAGSMTSGDQVAGKVDGSLDFDGVDDLVSTPDNNSLDFGTNSFAYSVWVYVPNPPGNSSDFDMPWHKGGSSTSQVGYDMELGNNAWKAGLSDGVTVPTVTFSSTPIFNAWTHLMAVVDRSAGRLKAYVNGVEVAAPGTAITGLGSLSSANIPRIGSNNAGQWDFKGQGDEVRVESVARSADWIKAQYLSMTDAFITYGSQEAVTCPPPAPFAPCSWQKRRKLTFNNAAQAENLVNFPVLVVLNSSRIDYGQTQNSGQDLRFTDSDGVTLLAHEIEKWDESGTSYVWVKVPQIDASSTTDHIWMYYGNATAPDGQDPGAVWSNGYAGVWHLGEASNTTRQDSTCNNNDVTDPTNVAAATGKIGSAADFVPTDYLTLSDGAAVGLELGTQFTLEAWAKGDEVTTNKVILSKEVSPNISYKIRFSSDRFTVTNSFDGSTDNIVNQTGTSVAGTWYYVVGTYNSPTMDLYLNGSWNKTLATAGGSVFNGTAPFNIGSKNNGTQPFDGIIDEARVSNVARSAAWISAQHKSMTDVFITYGTEGGPGASVSYYSPDAAAAGINVPVTFVGSFCSAPTVTTSSTDIVVGPSIVTDATGAVVTQNGTVLSTMFFVKPDARPKTGITVTVDGTTLSQTFDIVIPAPDPNLTSSDGSISGRTKRGTKVLGGLTVGSGRTLTIDTTDTDTGTAGNQGYLPAVILVKGDVNIAGTVDMKGQNGMNAAASCAGGDAGSGGPGGGGGGGGGMTETGCGSGSVAIDAVSTGVTTASSLTISHTTSGTNRLMLVGVSIVRESTGAPTVSSITYNGVGLSLVGAQATSDSEGRIEIWRLVAPATGANNVVVNLSAVPQSATVGVMTFTGVHQTTPLGTFAPALGESTSASVAVTSAAGELVFDTLVLQKTADVDFVPGAGQTERWDLFQGPGSANGGGSTEAGAASVTMSWSWSGTDKWAIGGVSIKPAPGGATAAPGGAGFSGGGGGGNKATGTGAAGGTGSGAVGSGASGATGGDGGTGLGGATGGGGGGADTGLAAGGGGGGGTGNPLGTGGAGAFTDNAAGGQGGGGGGAPGTTAGGGGGGGFSTAGTRGPNTPDAGFGGNTTGNAQLVPLMGGSGGGGGGPDSDIAGRGGGGAGGGGVVLIYATGSVTVSGTITAQGGNGGTGYTSGGNGSGGGGGGSGGSMLLQSGTITATGTLTTAGGAAGTGTGSASGGAGGSGRVRIDGLASGTTISTIPGTAGSRFIGPVIDTLVDKTVKGRADGGATVTLYVYDQNGAQVSGSPYTTSASGSSGTVGIWTISNVTFPSGTGYLAVKQSSGSYAVFGPGRPTKGLHLINWREVY